MNINLGNKSGITGLILGAASIFGLTAGDIMGTDPVDRSALTYQERTATAELLSAVEALTRVVEQGTTTTREARGQIDIIRSNLNDAAKELKGEAKQVAITTRDDVVATVRETLQEAGKRIGIAVGGIVGLFLSAAGFRDRIVARREGEN